MQLLRNTMFAVAAIAVFTLSANDANAQSYGSGYSYGLGFNSSTFYRPGVRGIPANRNFAFRGPIGLGGFIGTAQRNEDLPYFAKFPPVHYSGIVKRPYGISPYAVPPGIVPTEMQVKPAPQKVLNPHFDEEIQEVEAESQPVDKAENTTAVWTPNPYLDWKVQK